MPIPTLDLVATAIASVADNFPGENQVISDLDHIASEAPDDEEGLLGHVFGTCAFRGNSEHYYEASNSLIHDVVERRRGNPLSLSIVASEVARRNGVRLEPMSMPGHVVLGASGTDRWYDAFAGGRPLTSEDCASMFHRAFPEQAFTTDSLRPMSPVAVAARILQNLRVAALREGNMGLLAKVFRLRLELPDATLEERVELANVLALLGRFDLAAEQHELLATLRPDHAKEHRASAVRHRARNN